MTELEKQAYWINRRANKRGQGESPNLVIARHNPNEWKAIKEAEKAAKTA